MFSENKFTTNLSKFQLNGVNFTLWKHLPSNLYLPTPPHQTFDKKHFIRQHLLYHIHQLIQF